MKCENCPYGDHQIIYTKEGTSEIVICSLDDEWKDLDYECFFPETVMEKGV